ncbi:hypothetical protein CA13_15400 [Planctomycetes bacterium CA13]|uniref:Ice-binding protein C-terminal domain-containing protein n=1 Tax=Novipirellula herctigrandis TaxID=2527986 RepID=A0A5C5YZX1_9BACT|nr:hypothetical protein CA13_15400 [Planctomycetes bacterium CA13]
MMKRIHFAPLCVLVVLMVTAEHANAAFVVFDFRNTSAGAGNDLDGKASESTSITIDGVTLTLSAEAFVDGINSGTHKFNQTSSSFGIDANGSGDDTDTFDGGLGVESARFSISSSNVPLSSLELTEIKFNLFTDGDIGSLQINGTPTSLFDDDDLSNTNVLSVNQLMAVGQTFDVGYSAGNGFGLESMSFQATTMAVPEPSTLAFVGLASLFGFAVSRKRTDLGSCQLTVRRKSKETDFGEKV